MKHILGVERTAVELARLNGIDTEKASTAALLHDLLRDLSDKDTLKAAEELGFEPDDYTRENLKVAHGPLAALFAKEKLGVDDEDILNAVSCHTVANRKMSTLCKIIYLADAVEPSRDYEEAAKLRELAKKDLDEAYKTVLERTCDYIKSKGICPHPETLEAVSQTRKDDDF